MDTSSVLYLLLFPDRALWSFSIKSVSTHWVKSRSQVGETGTSLDTIRDPHCLGNLSRVRVYFLHTPAV